MSTKITPLGENVLIKMVTPETKTSAGIYIPESAVDEKTQQGIVEAIGDTDKAHFEKGSLVLFRKNYEKTVEYKSKEGDEYVIVRIKDVVAVVE